MTGHVKGIPQRIISEFPVKLSQRYHFKIPMRDFWGFHRKNVLWECCYHALLQLTCKDDVHYIHHIDCDQESCSYLHIDGKERLDFCIKLRIVLCVYAFSLQYATMEIPHFC